MAVLEKKDLCIPHEYTNEIGQKKTYWQRIGKYIRTDRSEFIKLEAVPTGNWNGVAQIFAERDTNTGNTGNTGGMEDNDRPF